MTLRLLRDPSVDSGEWWQTCKPTLGPLQCPSEWRGREGGAKESKEWEEGLDESCKTHVQKWENYFDQLLTCSWIGGGWMIKTSFLSKENPLFVTEVEIENGVSLCTDCSFIPTILMSLWQI